MDPVAILLLVLEQIAMMGCQPVVEEVVENRAT
jgi:hypothetical protein